MPAFQPTQHKKSNTSINATAIQPTGSVKRQQSRKRSSVSRSKGLKGVCVLSD